MLYYIKKSQINTIYKIKKGEQMRCPYCGSLDDKVIESRTMLNGESIRRRRECITCGYRFTSFERLDEKPFMLVKRDGRRQPFDRAKLERGIERAFEKRPFSSNQIEQISIDIEDLAIKKGREKREITTSELGDIVLEKLYALDKVAYIRFASVYKKFESLEQFINEIKYCEKEGN